jgi:prophage antirepressor-like protein
MTNLNCVLNIPDHVAERCPKVRMVGTPDKPEWVAQDMCDVLDLKNVSQALEGLDADEKGISIVDTLRGKQRMATVYEMGLYSLVMKSRKPAAKAFRKWVFGEVLPCIRKHGMYPAPENFSYPITLKPYTSRVVWLIHVRKALKAGYWCVFIEGAEVLIGMEHIFGPADLEMKQYDLLDGSIGSHWAKFRVGKPWAGERIKYEYTFPEDDPRGTVRPWAYPMQELEYFKYWLHGEYMTIHFPEYIQRKYGAARFQRAIPIFTSMGVPLLRLPRGR